jgi:hypothetical protein
MYLWLLRLRMLMHLRRRLLLRVLLLLLLLLPGARGRRLRRRIAGRSLVKQTRNTLFTMCLSGLLLTCYFEAGIKPHLESQPLSTCVAT